MLLLWTRGREKPLIQANDHDNNRQIFLYDTFDPGSRSNTLVPLSYDKFCQYNSIGGKKVLEKERLYYKNGREKDNGDTMKQDIEHKVVVLEALRDTSQSQRNGFQFCHGGTAHEVAIIIEHFRPFKEENLTTAQKILESFKKDYPQLFQERSCMEPLERLQKKVLDLDMQMTREKYSWDRLFSMRHPGINYEALLTLGVDGERNDY